MTRKQVVKALEQAGINYDKLVARKDGTFEFHNGYFYHHREYDANNLRKAKAAFPDAEVWQTDTFRSWPRDSYIATHIKPKA